MKMLKFFTSVLFISSMLIACKKDEPEPTNNQNNEKEYGSITLKFLNKVGEENLILNTDMYTNEQGETFTVSTFNYYISNIKLTATDNSVYVEPESYRLVEASDRNSLEFTLSNIPVKNYSSITFTIGVDSLRNTSGAQTGALDPARGMFWSWNSGYIMAKLEGTSPQSTEAENRFIYHVGGFSGVDNVLKTVTLPFQNSIVVSTSSLPEIKIKADVLEWFKMPTNLSIAALHTVHMPGADAKMVADNYADMFSITEVQN